MSRETLYRSVLWQNIYTVTWNRYIKILLSQKRLLSKHSHESSIINFKIKSKFKVNQISRTIKILSNRIFWETAKEKCVTNEPIPSVLYKCKCTTKLEKRNWKQYYTDLMIKRLTVDLLEFSWNVFIPLDTACLITIWYDEAAVCRCSTK